MRATAWDLGKALAFLIDGISRELDISFEDALTLFFSTEFSTYFSDVDTGVWTWGIKDALSVMNYEKTGGNIKELIWFGGDKCVS